MALEHLPMWWMEEDEGGRGQAMVDLIKQLVDRDSNRLLFIRVHHDTYDGRYLYADDLGSAVRFIGDQGVDRSQLNLTRSAVDFIHAKVTAQRPAVKCASRGGDWSQTLRARRLTRFLEAQADDLDLDGKASRAVREALVTGTGILKASAIDGKVQLDVVPTDELFVDPAEARYGMPPRMYQLRAVPRQELVDMFSFDPELAAVAEGAARPMDCFERRIPDDVDMVDVFEGWSLPDSEGNGGRHVLAVDGGTLVDEPWTCPRFPVAVVRDTEPAPGRGFWGQGLVERLVPNQDQIDDMVTQINDSLRIASRLKVFVPKGSMNLNVDALVDPNIGTVVEYDGPAAPQFIVPQSVGRELVEHLRFMIEQLYSQAGMSQDAASSMKPAGLNSGVALMTYHDFQTQRHIDLAKRFSKLVLDASELLIDRAKDLAAQDEDWTASAAGGPASRIKWSEVDMDRDSFVMELEAVSPVPESYAGRMQMIEQLAQSGKLPDGYVARMLEDPDIVRANAMLSANADYIDMATDMLLDPEKPMPEVRDYQDLQLTLDLIKAAALRAATEGAPPDVIDRFETYMNEVVDRIVAKEPPAPMPQDQAPAGIDPAAMAPVAATLPGSN